MTAWQNSGMHEIPESANARYQAIIRGRVQGVGYRQAAQRRAAQLALTGWVMNLEDGGVEVVAEGPRPALDAYVAWLRRGPIGAWVREVQVFESPARGEYREFTTRFL